MPDTAYTARQLEVLEGLDPVRVRPGMYTDTERPDHLAREAIDNAVDEALGGHATRVDVTLDPDGAITVADDGRGMPVDLHPTEKVSGVELILTRLHAGAKFRSDAAYEVAGGLHGVGISVVNALSTTLEVTVERAGKTHRFECDHGVPRGRLRVTERHGDATRRGTTVRFHPDPKYFEHPHCDAHGLAETLEAKAMLCADLETTLTHDGHTRAWRYPRGLADAVARSTAHQPALCPNPPFIEQVEANGTTPALDLALWFDPSGAPGPQRTFVNLIPTPAGGSHLQGLRNAVAHAIRAHAAARNLPAAKAKLTPDDCMAHARYFLSVRGAHLEFVGQTKEKVRSATLAQSVEAAVRARLTAALARHADAGDRIVALAHARADARLAAESVPVARKRTTGGPTLPGKLTDCSTRSREDAELFLVEGDSAGGSAKQARDRATQAVLPLRGKIRNTWELSSSQVLQSEAIRDIAVAIGLKPKERHPTKLRYGKICILADADSDGAHIAALLIALFEKHWPGLVEDGRVHLCVPPLYRIDAGHEVRYAHDAAARDAAIAALARPGKPAPQVQRFKGLGEMNPIQLRETTLAKDTRTLVRLRPSADPDDTRRRFDRLFASAHAAARRAWLGDEEENPPA